MNGWADGYRSIAIDTDRMFRWYLEYISGGYKGITDKLHGTEAFHADVLDKEYPMGINMDQLPEARYILATIDKALKSSESELGWAGCSTISTPTSLLGIRSLPGSQ